MELSTQKRMAVAAAAALAVALAATAIALPGSKKDDEKASTKSKGYVGVYMQELTKKLRKGLDIDVEDGVLVSGVEDDSPAESAGIKKGDVIVKFAGTDIASSDDLRKLVRKTEPGTKVDVELIRKGEKEKVQLTVGDLPDDFHFAWSGDDFDWSDMHWAGSPRGFRALVMGPRLGVTTAELNTDLAGYFKAKPGEGVLVLEVSEESVAEAAGVKAGDVIQRVGDEKIGEVGDLREAIEDFEEGDTFDIAVLRQGKSQTLKATMDDSANSWETSLHMPPMHKFGRNHIRIPHAPRVRVERWDDNDLREEMQDLRREIEALKEELGKKDG